MYVCDDEYLIPPFYVNYFCMKKAPSIECLSFFVTFIQTLGTISFLSSTFGLSVAVVIAIIFYTHEHPNGAKYTISELSVTAFQTLVKISLFSYMKKSNCLEEMLFL